MKKTITRTLLITILTLFVGIYNSLNAQTPTWNWVKSAGGIANDEGKCIATDAAGNVYMAGGFGSSSMTIGTTTLNSAGNNDVYIAKYDASGNAVWAKRFGGNNDDKANAITIDISGNIYICGRFTSGSIAFDTITLTNAGSTSYDGFIVKINQNGAVQWASSFGGNDNTDEATAIATDLFGNVIIGGEFSSVNFSIGTVVLHNSGTAFSGFEIFTAKYDNNGTLIWAKQGTRQGISVGSPFPTSFNFVFGVSVNDAGEIYLTGMFNSNQLIFQNDSIFNNGSIDIFIVKYDALGNELWLKGYGSSAIEEPLSTTLTQGGDLLITGIFTSSSLTFDSIILNNPGMFLANINSSGNTVWAKDASGTTAAGYAVITNSTNEIFVAGNFSSTITIGSSVLNANGGSDIFIAKYDSSGNPIWAKNTGGTLDDSLSDIVMDASDNLFVTGSFKSSSVSFDANTVTNVGSNDIFLSKLNSSNLHTGLETINLDSNISIYPNPFTTSFTLKINSIETLKNAEIKIYDTIGKEIKSISVNTNEIIINRNGLQNGIYFVKVYNGTKVYNQKIVVQ